MTTDQICIAVAECLGWTELGYHEGILFGKIKLSPSVVSNYPVSLDACAEFEKTLTEEERIAYGAEILNTLYLGSGSRWALLTATALQRCEAYLRVKGKWLPD